MVNLSLLEDLIKNANPQSTSENSVDEYFDQIVNYMEQEKINQAAKLIEKVFAKNVPDIRLIFYYFYAHFAENGIKSFAKTFPLAKSLINDHIEILTPKNRTDKHLQNSLNWFFSHLLQRFKYFEKLNGSGNSHAIWKKSVSETSLDELNQITEIVQEFNRFFLERWPLSPSKERVLHLIKKIDDIQQIVSENQKPVLEKKDETIAGENLEEKLSEHSEEPEIEPATQSLEDTGIVFTELNEEHEVHPSKDSTSDACIPLHEEGNSEPVETPPEREITEEIADEVQAQAEIQSQIPPSLSIPAKEDQDSVSASLHLFIESLDNLSHKLKIFEALIEKNDYLKAAVVANDIDHLIENFDPLSYFPKLFAKYYSIFAKNVTALTEQYEKKESLQVRALVKLYRTDLKMFLDW